MRLQSFPGVAGYQTVDLNFINYDNDREYTSTFTRTPRGTLSIWLTRSIESRNRTPAGRRNHDRESGLLAVAVVLSQLQPGGITGGMAATTEPIIIMNANQKDEVDTNFDTFTNRYPGLIQAGPLSYAGVTSYFYQRRQ